MKTTEKRKSLILAIKEKALNDDQIDFLYEIITRNNSLRDTLQIAGYTKEMMRKVDMAYPEPLRYKILEAGCDPDYFVYDYNKKSFGEFLNIAEKFGEKVCRMFMNW